MVQRRKRWRVSKGAEPLAAGGNRSPRKRSTAKLKILQGATVVELAGSQLTRSRRSRSLFFSQFLGCLISKGAKTIHGFHGVARAIERQCCGHCGGNAFSPTPPLSTITGERGVVGSFLHYHGAPVGGLLVRLWRPTLQLPIRAMPEGLFAALRSAASRTLLVARFGYAEPCNSLSSAPRRIPRLSELEMVFAEGRARGSRSGACCAWDERIMLFTAKGSGAYRA